MRARQFKATSATRCHWNGEGHHNLIPAGRVAYQITEGKAQGIYHGPQCYQAALKKYIELEKQVLPPDDE